MMTAEQQIDHHTQEIVKAQIGDLVLTAARQRAELIYLRAENERLKTTPPEPSPDESH